MTWDEEKSPGDLITSSDFNDGVTDQLTRGIPESEELLGSDCTGNDAETGRTLTLSETTIKSSGLIVVVSNNVLNEGASKDYSISGNVITFNNKIWDDMKIRIIYFT